MKKELPEYFAESMLGPYPPGEPHTKLLRALLVTIIKRHIPGRVQIPKAKCMSWLGPKWLNSAHFTFMNALMGVNPDGSAGQYIRTVVGCEGLSRSILCLHLLLAIQEQPISFCQRLDNLYEYALSQGLPHQSLLTLIESLYCINALCYDGEIHLSNGCEVGLLTHCLTPLGRFDQNNAAYIVRALATVTIGRVFSSEIIIIQAQETKLLDMVSSAHCSDWRRFLTIVPQYLLLNPNDYPLIHEKVWLFGITKEIKQLLVYYQAHTCMEHFEGIHLLALIDILKSSKLNEPYKRWLIRALRNAEVQQAAKSGSPILMLMYALQQSTKLGIDQQALNQCARGVIGWLNVLAQDNQAPPLSTIDRSQRTRFNCFLKLILISLKNPASTQWPYILRLLSTYEEYCHIYQALGPLASYWCVRLNIFPTIVKIYDENDGIELLSIFKSYLRLALYLNMNVNAEYPEIKYWIRPSHITPVLPNTDNDIGPEPWLVRFRNDFVHSTRFIFNNDITKRTQYSLLLKVTVFLFCYHRRSPSDKIYPNFGLLEILSQKDLNPLAAILACPKITKPCKQKLLDTLWSLRVWSAMKQGHMAPRFLLRTLAYTIRLRIQYIRPLDDYVIGAIWWIKTLVGQEDVFTNSDFQTYGHSTADKESSVANDKHVLPTLLTGDHVDIFLHLGWHAAKWCVISGLLKPLQDLYLSLGRDGIMPLLTTLRNLINPYFARVANVGSILSGHQWLVHFMDDVRTTLTYHTGSSCLAIRDLCDSIVFHFHYYRARQYIEELEQEQLPKYQITFFNLSLLISDDSGKPVDECVLGIRMDRVFSSVAHLLHSLLVLQYQFGTEQLLKLTLAILNLRNMVHWTAWLISPIRSPSTTISPKLLGALSSFIHSLTPISDAVFGINMPPAYKDDPENFFRVFKLTEPVDIAARLVILNYLVVICCSTAERPMDTVAERHTRTEVELQCLAGLLRMLRDHRGEDRSKDTVYSPNDGALSPTIAP